MKELSNFEKDVIRFLVGKSETSEPSTVKINDLVENFTSCKYEYELEEKKIYLLVPKDEDEDEYVKRSFVLMDICLLVQYLNDNKYIFCLSRTSYNAHGYIGKNEHIEGEKKYSLDKKMVDIAMQYINCFLFVSLSLKDFAKEFKTNAQIRHEQQIKKANHTIMISWFAFLIAFFSTSYGIYQNWSMNNTQKEGVQKKQEQNDYVQSDATNINGEYIIDSTKTMYGILKRRVIK